jgi:hypothetical protein
MYKEKSLIKKIFLRWQLYNLNMKDGGLVHEHLNEHNSLISKLMAVYIKIDPEEKAILLLCSILELWDNLIISLNHATALDIDSVLFSLLMEELR